MFVFQLSYLVSVHLALRSAVQITPHPRSAFSCRSSEASTNTSLIDEAVSTLGKAADINTMCQFFFFKVFVGYLLFATMPLSHILYAVDLWARV